MTMIGPAETPERMERDRTWRQDVALVLGELRWERARLRDDLDAARDEVALARICMGDIENQLVVIAGQLANVLAERGRDVSALDALALRHHAEELRHPGATPPG